MYLYFMSRHMLKSVLGSEYNYRIYCPDMCCAECFKMSPYSYTPSGGYISVFLSETFRDKLYLCMCVCIYIYIFVLFKYYIYLTIYNQIIRKFICFLNGPKAFQFVCRWWVRAVNSSLLYSNIIIKIVVYSSCLSGLLRNYCNLRSQICCQK